MDMFQELSLAELSILELSGGQLLLAADVSSSGLGASSVLAVGFAGTSLSVNGLSTASAGLAGIGQSTLGVYGLSSANANGAYVLGTALSAAGQASSSLAANAIFRTALSASGSGLAVPSAAAVFGSRASVSAAASLAQVAAAISQGAVSSQGVSSVSIGSLAIASGALSAAGTGYSIFYTSVRRDAEMVATGSALASPLMAAVVGGTFESTQPIDFEFDNEISLVEIGSTELTGLIPLISAVKFIGVKLANSQFSAAGIGQSGLSLAALAPTSTSIAGLSYLSANGGLVSEAALRSTGLSVVSPYAIRVFARFDPSYYQSIRTAEVRGSIRPQELRSSIRPADVIEAVRPYEPRSSNWN